MHEDDDLIAGELALGLLEGDERAAALRLVITDPDFARAVERWRDRLAHLHGEWAEADPGAAAERRALRITDGGAGGGVNDNRVWRWVAGASSLAAAALLAVVVTRPPAPAIPPSVVAAGGPLMVAVLKPEGGGPFGAVYDPRGHAVRLGGGVTAPTGRQLELWAIGGDGVPHAAGLVPVGVGRVAVGTAVSIDAGTVLALSVEPLGGSPKATPTGPVVATGKLAAL